MSAHVGHSGATRSVCSLPPCGGGLGGGVVVERFACANPPPPPPPPHRKSGLPDLRTIMRNPGKLGFRGEGSTSSLWRRQCSSRPPHPIDDSHRVGKLIAMPGDVLVGTDQHQ